MYGTYMGGGLLKERKPTSLSIDRLLVRVGPVAAQHLAVLADADALALDDLDVREAADDLVLDLEGDDHGELGALLDGEGLVLERGLAARLGEVDRDGRAAGGLEREGLDDAGARVRRVGEVLAAAEAEGFFVALEGFVVCVCPLCGGNVSIYYQRSALEDPAELISRPPLRGVEP